MPNRLQKLRIRSLLAGIAVLASATSTAATELRPGTEHWTVEDPSPPDGSDTWKVRKDALAAYRAEDWESAGRLYARAVRENPADGALWERYGLALLSGGRPADAAGAFERCRAIGYRWHVSTYNLVCALSRAGQVDAALDRLEEAFANGYVADHHSLDTDPDIAAIRKHPRFAGIVGRPPAGEATRAERWRYDLGYLDERLRKLHFAPFGVLPEAEWERQLAELRDAVDGLTDEQLRWGVQRLLGSVGDGHTTVVPEWFVAAHGGHPIEYDTYPLEFWWYPDGVRLRTVPADRVEAAGARVTAIGGRPIDEVVQLALDHASRDNDPGAYWIAMNVLASPSALRAFGLADANGTVKISLEGASAPATLTASATPNRNPVPAFSLGDDAAGELPLRRRHADRHYWFEILEDGVVYFRYNAVRDERGESIAEFTTRMFDAIRAADANALIVDLRGNHGGNSQLSLPLLHRIAASHLSRRGNLYVIIGRQTFSAAMNFATSLEVHTQARFVGEPTGSRPNFVGETSLFHLPYSGLPVSCSSRWFQGTMSTDRRQWIPAHIPAPMTVEAEAAGRDPALEAILRILAADRAASG